MVNLWTRKMCGLNWLVIILCLNVVWNSCIVNATNNLDNNNKSGKSACKRSLQKLVNEDVADSKILSELPSNGK